MSLMVVLPLLLGAIFQQARNPAAGIQAAKKVEFLLADIRVLGPFKTYSISEYSQTGQGTGWLVQTISGDRDLYEGYVSSFGGTVEIVRGYGGYDNRDLAKTALLPPDSPVILSFADYLMDRLAKRHELGEPILTQFGDNSMGLLVPVLQNGRPFAGPGDSFISVSFRPDLGVIAGFSQSKGDVPVNAKNPSLSMEIAQRKAQKALEEKVDREEDAKYDAGRMELTGKSELVNYLGFLEKTARLAWSFQYKISYKTKSENELPSDTTVEPTIGNICIDSYSGAFLGADVIRSRFESRGFNITSRIGKYGYVDGTKWGLYPAIAPDDISEKRYELFKKIKSGELLP